MSHTRVAHHGRFWFVPRESRRCAKSHCGGVAFFDSAASRRLRWFKSVEKRRNGKEAYTACHLDEPVRVDQFYDY